MSIQIAQLGAGQSINAGTFVTTRVTDASGGGSDLYALAAAKAAIVKNMRFVNIHASSTAVLTVYLRKQTATGPTVYVDYQISPALSLAPGTLYVDNDEITLLRITGGFEQ